MVAKNKIPRPVLPVDIGVEQFAGLVGITEAAVRNKLNSGLLVRTNPNMVNMQDALRAYTADLRRVASGRESETPSGLTDERQRLAKAQADTAILKISILEKSYLPAAEVERTWATFLREARSRLLAVPSRLRQRLPGLTTAEVNIIDRELRDALEELGNG